MTLSNAYLLKLKTVNVLQVSLDDVNCNCVDFSMHWKAQWLSLDKQCNS